MFSAFGGGIPNTPSRIKLYVLVPGFDVARGELLPATYAATALPGTVITHINHAGLFSYFSVWSIVLQVVWKILTKCLLPRWYLQVLFKLSLSRKVQGLKRVRAPGAVPAPPQQSVRWSWDRTQSRSFTFQSHLPLQIHGEGSLPGLPNLLGSTVNILITPSPCIYREFLETGLVPSWNEINFQPLRKTERYSLPGSERLIVGEPVQPSHSSPAACAKGRVLWGLFTQRAPEHLPAHRLAR